MLVGALFGPGLPLAAQDSTSARLAPAARVDATGTLLVRARRGGGTGDSTALSGAFVRSGRIGGVTDGSGVARLVLPAMLRSVIVSRAGYEPRTFEITIVANAPQRVDIFLDSLSADGDRAIVSATRGDRRVSAEPIAVTVLGAEAITEEAQSHPTDLTRLFSSSAAFRPQRLSGPLDATRLRIGGLPGQYTGLLVDGLPLLGGQPGGFGLMQLSPLEFAQVEVVSGAATALYGPAAAGGVINLVSRRPERDAARVTANQSSEKGGDFAFWGARRQSPTLSATWFSDLHQQRLVDSDDDGWGEFPRAIRFSLRPRLFVDAPNGDGLVATAGAMSEDRTGGFLNTITGENLYREELKTRRFDGGLTARHFTGQTGRFTVRLSAVFQSTTHRFAALREADRRSTLFGELSYSGVAGPVTAVVGISHQRDALHQRDLRGFDYTHSVPAAFAQVTLTASPKFTGSVSGRCDDHSVQGLYCTPQVSLLLRPRPEFDARLSAGTGFFAPTPLTDEVEAIGLHGTVPSVLRAERIRTASANLTWRRGPLQLRGTLAASRLMHPVRLVPVPGDSARRLRLVNLTGPTQIVSGELSAVYRTDQITASAFYGYLHGTEAISEVAGRRRETNLTPRHTLGLDLAWQAPRTTGTRVDLATVYTGRQFVWDNPFRTETPGYVLMHLLVSQPAGRARLYLSGENLSDVKLRSYEPVQFSAAPALGDRRTTTPWAPLRGRVISLGALVDW